MPKLTSFRGKSRWPMPVYIATLASGETARISFWSPADKPLDIARGRAVAAQQCGITPWPRTRARDGNGQWLHDDNGRPVLVARIDLSLPLPRVIPARIVAGEVEYDGELYGDTMTDNASVWPAGELPKPKKPAPAWHALAMAMLERGDAAAALAVLRQAA